MKAQGITTVFPSTIPDSSPSRSSEWRRRHVSRSLLFEFDPVDQPAATDPVAPWIVQNWWSLLNELCSWDAVPTVAVDGTQSRWLKRHCLRSADSSLMLP